MRINDFTFGDTVTITSVSGEKKSGIILSYSYSKNSENKIIPGSESACLTYGTKMNAYVLDLDDRLWSEVYNAALIEPAKMVLIEKAFIKKIYDYANLDLHERDFA